jgi:hypothetical protein
VVGGEPLDERGCVLDFAVHENVRVRHEDVVDDDNGFLPAELRVALIDRAALQRAIVAALTAIDVRDARRVHGHRGDDCIRPICWPEPHRRHDDQPVRVHASRLVHLGSAQHDAVRPALHHVHEQIRILLLGRALASIALGIRHCPADDEVLALHVVNERFEARVIVGALGLVDVVAD